MASSFKIVTLNTWKCEGRYWDRLHWMAKGLQELAPDFVFLQEAFFCSQRNADTAGQLAAALGFRVYRCRGRGKFRTFDGDERWSSSDLAILSPITPVQSQEFQLVAHPADTDRKALALDFEINGLAMRLVNTHLTHINDPAGQAIRLQQAQHIYDLASPKQAAVCIAGGDLNAVPDSPELNVFSEFSDDRMRLLPIERDPRGTMQGERFIADQILARIDHLFVYKNPNCNAHVTLNRETVIMDRPIGSQGEFSSDHAAVSVELSVDTTAHNS